MESSQIQPPPLPPGYGPPPPPPPPPAPSSGDMLKKLLAPLGVVGVLLVKFGAKLKFIVWPLLKFFPVILKTGGTMAFSIWVYAQFFGAWFAVGIVVLIFVHECGHLLAARKCGLKVGAPVFIPFMGAFIALKDAPRNAWIEAQVGIGGPMLGALGAGICEMIYLATEYSLFRAVAYFTFMLNLLNLIPISPLDGGRIATALSPWLWIVGFATLVGLTIMQPNPVLILILVGCLPRLFTLFRSRSETEQRYFEVTPLQRWTMAIMYFGLIALLVIGMEITYIPHDTLRSE